MKAVILAGGLGTRISEETHLKPKPMIEVGGRPILWHILKLYSSSGINEFVICCGYKGYVIKEYFANYFLHTSDVTIDIQNNRVEVHQKRAEPWKITLVDTGEASMTGGRLLRVRDYIQNEHAFCLTYGDGVSNVDLTSLVQFHLNSGLAATVTAVKMPGRFGSLSLDQDIVENFIEKPTDEGSWINGGFFVFTKKIFDYINDDNTLLENEPLVELARDRNLGAWKHDGFWQPMDTLRDKRLLENYWSSGRAPWISKSGS